MLTVHVVLKSTVSLLACIQLLIYHVFVVLMYQPQMLINTVIDNLMQNKVMHHCYTFYVSLATGHNKL